MGGCNSTLNDIELGGAVIASGVSVALSGGASTGAAIAGTAALGTYMATKQGCSRSKSAIINATNQIIATAMIQSLTFCTQISETWQQLNIKCDPALNPGEVYEGNYACGVCVKDVFEGMLAQHALERKMWDRDNPSDIGVRLDINSEYTLLMGRVGTCGMVACKACTLANISQSNILANNSNCYTTLTDTTQFQSNLSGLLKQQLVNNQDVLAGVARVFSNNNVSTITQDITNRISTQVNSTFLNNFVSRLQNTQIITLDSNSGFSARNIAQINSFQIAVQYVAENNVVTNSISDSAFDLIAQVANEQNTLNDVGTLTFEATVGFQQAISNVVGQVMIATLVLLGVVVLVILCYAGYRFIKKQVVRAENTKTEQDLTLIQKSAFQQF